MRNISANSDNRYSFICRLVIAVALFVGGDAIAQEHAVSRLPSFVGDIR
jgi:hypothetical protein